MKRVIAVAAGLAAAGILVGFYISAYLIQSPQPVGATKTSAGSANLVLQTVPAYGSDPTPDWVSYFTQDSSGNWVHSTYLRVPAYSTIHVTLYQYDSASGFRDPLWAQPRGVTGGVIGITSSVKGSKNTSVSTNLIDPTTAAHSFAIPDLGVSVPLLGIPSSASNTCPAGPCTTDFDHETITFSFYSGPPGEHRWQCFVPCAASFYFGFGGPMQTFGYMDGELIVS